MQENFSPALIGEINVAIQKFGGFSLGMKKLVFESLHSRNENLIDTVGVILVEESLPPSHALILCPTIKMVLQLTGATFPFPVEYEAVKDRAKFIARYFKDNLQFDDENGEFVIKTLATEG